MLQDLKLVHKGQIVYHRARATLVYPTIFPINPSPAKAIQIKNLLRAAARLGNQVEQVTVPALK